VTTTDLNVPTSWELVQRAQQGDAEAFGQIFDRYIDQVYRFIYYRVGSREIAEDFTSETFLRAWRSIDGFVYMNRDIANWLYTIARRIVIDHFKSAAYRLTRSVPDFEDPGHRHSTSADTHPELYPAEVVTDYILRKDLLKALLDLDDDQRECLILRTLMERTVIETGQIMGKKPGAVKQLHYRAVRALRRAVPHLQDDWTA
jgi:RNA polymerase sigma-70 factor (ECF subfamily)